MLIIITVVNNVLRCVSLYDIFGSNFARLRAGLMLTNYLFHMATGKMNRGDSIHQVDIPHQSSSWDKSKMWYSLCNYHDEQVLGTMHHEDNTNPLHILH